MADADAEGQKPGTDALIGRTVGGRFDVTERIARGGMACVYFATQRPLNRPAAIKVLRPDGGAEDRDSFQRRFLLEASMLSQLQHPNIVTLLDYGKIDELPGDHYFMAMEYLAGETLGKRLRSRGTLTVVETLRIARQIGRGLREAHRRGFVHRDLKPSNIILVPEDDQNDIVKLVDFGIGKVLTQPNHVLAAAEEEDVTRVGLLLGSPRHMAPEQIRGDAIEARTDLYGLGVIMFQLLSGRLPFDGPTEIEILLAHCSTEAPKLTEVCPDRFVPESLSNLVDSLLRKQVAARPTIYEFLLKLADVEDEVFGALGMAGPTLSQRPSIPPSVPPSAQRPRMLTFDDQSTERATTPDLQPPSAPTPGNSSREALESQSFVTQLISAPQQRNKRLGIVIACALAFLGVVAGALAWSPTRAAPHAGAPPVATSVSALGPKPESPTFPLSIESTPSGAEVIEGNVLLGRTPLTLAVEHAAVALAPRHFSIEHSGYIPYQFSQGSSTGAITVLAKLKAKQAAASSPATARVRSSAIKVPIASAIASASATRTTTTAYPVKGDDSLEIRTRR